MAAGEGFVEVCGGEDEGVFGWVHGSVQGGDTSLRRGTTPGRRTPSRWAALIARIYEVLPLVCPSCGGSMSIIPAVPGAGSGPFGISCPSMHSLVRSPLVLYGNGEIHCRHTSENVLTQFVASGENFDHERSRPDCSSPRQGQVECDE